MGVGVGVGGENDCKTNFALPYLDQTGRPVPVSARNVNPEILPSTHPPPPQRAVLTLRSLWDRGGHWNKCNTQKQRSCSKVECVIGDFVPVSVARVEVEQTKRKLVIYLVQV